MVEFAVRNLNVDDPSHFSKLISRLQYENEQPEAVPMICHNSRHPRKEHGVCEQKCYGLRELMNTATLVSLPVIEAKVQSHDRSTSILIRETVIRNISRQVRRRDRR